MAIELPLVLLNRGYAGASERQNPAIPQRSNTCAKCGYAGRADPLVEMGANSLDLSSGW